MSDNRRIVITGVGRGLGLAMTEGFIQRGHTVIGCSQNPKHIDKVSKRFGAPHRFDPVNVADEAAVKLWAKAVLSDGGPPDLLKIGRASCRERVQRTEVDVDV